MRPRGFITFTMAALALLVFLAGAALAGDYYVRPDGSDSNTGQGNTAALAFQTIQKAVDSAAPSGDTIHVAAGTYVEVVTIRDKSLRLEGGEAMPGIPAGTTAVEMPVSRTLDPTKTVRSGKPADPVIWVEDTTPAMADVYVKLFHITVDGASRYVASPNVYFMGIAFKNCTGLVAHGVVENIQQNPPAGAQGCAGIVLDGNNAYADTMQVTAYDCTVRNVQKAGIVIFEGTGHVRNCQVIGYGPVGFIAQNGIQFGPSVAATPAAGGSVHGNVVSGFEYSGGGWSSSGVLVYGPAGILEAIGNTVTGCDVGFYVTGTSDIAAHRISANNINNYKFEGIYTQAPGTGSYLGNRFQGSRFGSGAAFDDGPSSGIKNYWIGNFYYDLTSVSTRPVPGYANNVDPDGRPAPKPFAPAVARYTGSNDPRGIVTADLNGDGKLDVAFVNYTGHTVSIRYGDGAGGIAGSQNATLPVGSKPTAIAVGNLNATPGLDLAVACENSTVVTLLNNNGANPYARFPTVGVPVLIGGVGIAANQRPSAIAVGDVDGVNHDDILIALAGSNPLLVPGGGLVLINGGTGFMFAGLNPFGPITSSYGCDLADLDGDGDLDAVFSDTGLTLPKFVNNVMTYTNSGGLFSAGPVLSAGLSPRGLACHDLDNDGLPEIVVANFGNPTSFQLGSVSVFQNRTMGLLAFAPTVDTPTDYGTMGVVVGDAFGNNNGVMAHWDVAAVNYNGNNVTLLLDWKPFSLVGGAFAAVETLTGVSIPFGGVAMGDLDGNGADDLFVTNYGTDDVSYFEGKLGAQISYLGLGCEGYKHRIPVVGVEGGLPAQPNYLFNVTVANARPNSGAVLGGSLSLPNPLPAECGLLLGNLDLLFISFTDGNGTAKWPIALPFMPPDISGVYVYWQWGIFDVDGVFFGLSLSNGITTRVGI